MMQIPKNLEAFVRSRAARLGLATLFIAVSVWAFVPYVTYRIAPSAFINAELMRVTAPIAGKLTQDLPRKGRFITEPEKLPLLGGVDAHSTNRNGRGKPERAGFLQPLRGRAA